MKSEDEIIDNIKLFFEKKGFRVITEVPLLTKRIDIICLKNGINEIIAIEVKIQNWKRGLQQASVYRICSDFVYLAIHRDFSHRVDIKLLQRAGIGLIVVDEDGVEIIFKISNQLLTHQGIKNNIISYCGGDYFASI